MAEQILAELKKIPPVTRVSVVSLVGLTVPVMAKLVNPAYFVYFGPWVWSKFQLWRIPTAFFVGSTNINFVFEVAMLYRMLNQLESGHFAGNSSDLAFQLAVAGTSIILATRPLSSVLFLHSLLACLSYVTSALAPPGAQTSLMGLVTLPVRYFPYVMVVMDLLMAGPRAAAESVAGIIVGHAWWWGVWGGDLSATGGVLAEYALAPAWLRRFFGEGARRRREGEGTRTATGGVATGLRASGIEVVAPRRVANASSPEGHQWGQGNRLGS
ncbi:hypothetical protein D9611_013192 [Ephemerocybe angulata]|uniref:Derlin n=1 Tax=Ephemerocybe angulata TaxID=980116 RepID=A0A8H5BTN7_9AGAR|nr:hypothetical protein D9611_013192 [Tulosesus angulatus]